MSVEDLQGIAQRVYERATARANARPDQGWDYDPCAAPTVGLRRAIERKRERCLRGAPCLERFDAILSEMKTTLDQPMQPTALRAPWVSAFPDVDIHAPESIVKKHPRYKAAKGGDTAAAVDLVLDTMSETAIERLRAYQDLAPVIVPVHGLEGVSSNTIPAALAVCLAETLGFNLSAEIVQTSRAAHTGSSGWWRLKSQALFSGEVTQGEAYILVDDFVGMGGTFASLRGLIEAKGGKVIHAQALTGKPRSARLALQPETLQALREKHGHIEPWWRTEVGYEFDALTESEALYLLRIEQADTIRRRLVEAKPQRDD